jgi:alpha-amylase/alpha-mannosidase (GH57 family)
MPTPQRYICVHGHFYQPPRENPWLETVEIQDSAAPYHDWNERICSECYATNGAARVVNTQNLITRIFNNYARMSFNFGPTLLSWLADNAQRTYRMILEGERTSRELFEGHSSAMAQAYNHIIMPLANRRDRITQIRWGIADYRQRYGHMPEGMWLAETAADTETLELMAAEGIRFTVLAPHQAKRVRPIQIEKGPRTSGATPGALRVERRKTARETAKSASGNPQPAGGVLQPADTVNPTGDWFGTPNASVDPTHPYLVRFASGLSMAVFFYDGPTSRAVAFEGLLNSGETFANRLKQGFRPNNEPQLMHIATDGESYGHHHKHGEMALAYALRLIQQDPNLGLANYGFFLEKFPLRFEAEINDNTSWSCAHGVERWRSNCGCNGGKPGWNQLWRGPLREGLDLLRDTVAPLTESLGATLFKDVWAARDRYIDVILDRSTESVDRFFLAHQDHILSPQERTTALSLMEMQRHTQLMYTSCGWFFDDISGIETVQIIAYAARVIQLAQDLFAESVAELETAFLGKLVLAKSNVVSAGDGARIYSEQALSMELTLEQVAAHYAISSVFSSFADETELFCYRVQRISYEIFNSGRGRLALGRAKIIASLTGQENVFSFAVLHFGDQNITAAVKAYDPSHTEALDKVAAAAREQVQLANFPEVIRILDRFYELGYSLTSLFRDEQRRIVQLILNSTLGDIESSLKTIYDDHASLLHFLTRAGLPKPPALALAGGFAVNAGLRRALETDPVDLALVRSFLGMADADGIQLDTPTLAYIADLRMKRAMLELQMSSGSLDMLDRALSLARTLTELPFEINLWQAQNIWYEILRSASYSLTAHNPEERPKWLRDFNELGCCLSIACDVIMADEPAAAATGD